MIAVQLHNASRMPFKLLDFSAEVFCLRAVKSRYSVSFCKSKCLSVHTCLRSVRSLWIISYYWVQFVFFKSRSSPSYLSCKVSWLLCTSSSLSGESKFAKEQRQGRWCLGCGPAEGAHGTVTGILFWSHMFCSSSCRYSIGSTRPAHILRHADLEGWATWQTLCKWVQQ